MCTVVLRFRPGTAWPLLLGAVRDEFADRAWDPPGQHWGDRLTGGRDRVAGGTWLAVDPDRPAVAALLNGPRLPVPADGRRPTRGDLPVAALRGDPLPDPARYDGFHLVVGSPAAVDVWTWDGTDLTHRALDAGDHVIVNAGVDADTPLVARLLPEMAALPAPDPEPGKPVAEAWDGWVDLLGGGDVDPAGTSALIVHRIYEDRVYASTSATLLALSPDSVRYDFTAPPGAGASWDEVATLSRRPDRRPARHHNVSLTPKDHG
jgi:hypothetical protein